MKKRMRLKWFTLIEMIIVMVIIGILAVVLTESYITISKVALRVEQEKNLSEESLVLTQVFQAISDEATIDYEAYSGNGINLEEDNWFTNVLYLTWWQWSWTKIFTTGNCLDLDDNFVLDENWVVDKNIWDYTDCSLILEQKIDDQPIMTQLITPWKVVISKVIFKIIPYDTDENYSNSDWIIVNNLHQPAFWMFIHLYAPIYQPVWTNKIDQPLQLFFNLKL